MAYGDKLYQECHGYDLDGNSLPETLTYKFDSNGGFVAADLVARIAAYAYPTSIFANRAHRTPETIAREMIDEAAKFTTALASDHFEYLIKKHFSA